MLTKKWLFVGLLTLLSLQLGIAAPPATHPVTGEPLIITCLKGTPAAIDGDLADWNLAALTPAVLDASAQVYTGQTTWTGVDDCSAEFYVLWDDTKIYVAAVVKDDKIVTSKTNGDIWNCDCVEVFFGTTERGTSASDHTQHYQFGFNAAGQYWNWCNMDSAGQSLPTFMQAAAIRTPTGYTCEVALEYARISALPFVAGNTLGFHPCVDDTEATDRELQITWTGREAHDQSLGFGYLILSDDPAVAKELARNPSPADGAEDVKVDAALSWQAGQFAASHDVYFGTTLDDVNNATRANPLDVLAGQGQADAQFDPQDALEYGRTYYWRVDEVNAAPDGTIFKGQLWSFTTEPYAYPITSVTATASASQADMGPENTIDGSGLDDNDAHSSQSVDMWMSAGDKPHWIQYEFDKVYKLHELWVWNSNQLVEMFLGLGAKTVTIEHSLDGQTWTLLEGVPEFARAPAAPDYKANTSVAFGGVAAKFVKLTIEENWGGVAPQTGLSEVRFFYVPVQAYAAEPADGATEVSLDAELTWRPGREAESHVVYFGTDEASLAEAGSATETGYAPAALEFGTTYYWKVDELGGGGPYEGEVWSFVTQEYGAIDDFEDYNDDVDAGTTIWNAWEDGVTNKASGSQVGYTESPFAEKAVVHGGKQSMPLLYDNSLSPYYSEAERLFGSPQDLTAHGADSLCVWFQGIGGDTGNSSEGLYITVKDNSGKSKTIANADASATVATTWTQWTIPLSEFTAAGVKMTAVKSIVIGVGNRTSPTAGGTGKMYIDDIGYGRSSE